MTRLCKTTLAAALMLGLAGVAAAQTPVFFSEYIEGSSNNKAVGDLQRHQPGTWTCPA
ncbi:MAG: hypothetical protein IPH09_14360 [bacterium]|nr:hypothetical protein [bacterium]